MSEYQQYYESFSTGNWADPHPDRCRCHGSGHALSEVDTLHRCPYHFKGSIRIREEFYSDPFDIGEVIIPESLEKMISDERAEMILEVEMEEAVSESMLDYFERS